MDEVFNMSKEKQAYKNGQDITTIVDQKSPLILLLFVQH